MSAFEHILTQTVTSGTLMSYRDFAGGQVRIYVAICNNKSSSMSGCINALNLESEFIFVTRQACDNIIWSHES